MVRGGGIGYFLINTLLNVSANAAYERIEQRTA